MATTVFDAVNGNDGIVQAAQCRPDIILLDLGLPDLDGVEVLKRIREWSRVPVIILSVRDREDDKIAALDAGADDFVTKPFSSGELLARLRTTLRRSQPQSAEAIFRSGNFEVDLAARIVRKNGEEVKLTPTEYSLLRLLVVHAGKVMTHRQLLTEVWGPNAVGANALSSRPYRPPAGKTGGRRRATEIHHHRTRRRLPGHRTGMIFRHHPRTTVCTLRPAG